MLLPSMMRRDWSKPALLSVTPDGLGARELEASQRLDALRTACAGVRYIGRDAAPSGDLTHLMLAAAAAAAAAGTSQAAVLVTPGQTGGATRPRPAAGLIGSPAAMQHASLSPLPRFALDADASFVHGTSSDTSP